MNISKLFSNAAVATLASKEFGQYIKPYPLNRQTRYTKGHLSVSFSKKFHFLPPLVRNSTDFYILILYPAAYSFDSFVGGVF